MKKNVPHKELPINISTFSHLIENNCIYVDKTHYIHEMFKGASRYYFLSRPRRFGKSLLISTLKELFLGNKQLFKGLYIEQTAWEWKQHPVIHLDFSVIAHRNPKDLLTSIHEHLNMLAQEHGIELNGTTFEDKLSVLIPALAQKDGVVLLVDEYDKPLLNTIHKFEAAAECREILKSFYEVIKGLDAYFRAIFVTGVSKCSKVSLFSGMNNLNDISLDSTTAGLLGYTHEELVTYFAPYIESIAQKIHKSSDEIIEEMRSWYNGYRFSDSDLKVYSPYSVLYYLYKQKQANYWLESATPQFLVHLLEKQFTLLNDFELVDFSQESLGKIDLESIPLITLLFQTGYLTIKSHDPETNTYKLTLPNAEVRDSFDKYILISLAHNNSATVDSSLAAIKRALAHNDMHLFVITLRSLFANIPFNLHIQQESYYHSLFHFLTDMLGLDVQSEISMSRGRMDLVLTTKDRIYLFECKFDKTGQEALQQIKDRGYYEKYLSKNKPITIVGISFNYKHKQFAIDWENEEIARDLGR